jgi:hypothetical protein
VSSSRTLQARIEPLKGPSLILLAFLFPLALYLLILGAINRRTHPLMVSGPWDFVGLLFAASGFLLFGGPGALSVINDRWRDALVFGQAPSGQEAVETLWQWWLFLMIAYFAVIVAGSGFFLWRSRNQTSIYNTDADTFRSGLGCVFERLGLHPTRTGNSFYFASAQPDRSNHLQKSNETERIQTMPSEYGTGLRVQTAPTPALSLHNVMLEVDVFPLMSHVTLRWEPARTGLRQEIEQELERELARTPGPNNLLGGWLTLLACFLFMSMFLIGFAVLIYRLLHPV